MDGGPVLNCHFRRRTLRVPSNTSFDGHHLSSRYTPVPDHILANRHSLQEKPHKNVSVVIIKGKTIVRLRGHADSAVPSNVGSSPGSIRSTRSHQQTPPLHEARVF